MSCLALPANKDHFINLPKYLVVIATVAAGNLTDETKIPFLDAAAEKKAFGRPLAPPSPP
eukprot:CAMPEP_0179460316 /NCGR_PEP_ID=MMETSP0799-20121207/43407_1 /TAXON_ID=46947 /ORGANISM="Geminigera cryophila, Strain CCMP2564" /LENGTH=59 /DNA_ID=CAMNT_0021262527 /DNA_START=49 /DNA_END=228 /DNA_ORIENTATION=+